ncbi:agmatinase family protein [Pontibacillus marinus]|uniref:Formimidoylglutamase n=1 Tax=Pontibacillus marinus BH030004 = DSM 16465 TaxID=1385511 RepID=A0A0A5GKP9_9BACI|nr:agmatinase family protein [Pontibacillus marinus]KGX91745.1 formimidoylglutamase [Pontibacillus marinus BH030004 = DSM 16465]
MQYPYPLLNPPPFVWTKDENNPNPKVHEWIQDLSHQQGAIDWDHFDVAIMGIPLSRSSISASSASENPDAIRRAWKSFYPYNLEHDVDLTELNVVDLGDVRQHVTDIAQCHQNITDAMAAQQTHHPNVFPLTIGGDHSITAMLVKGWKEVHPDQEVGILQLDTHFDLRSLEEFGPANGTPIRNLIESGTVQGSNVHNIGLHGFFNSKSLKDYADHVGLHYKTVRDVRKEGIDSIVKDALDQLSKKVDVIYLTVDMDVLDMSGAPGVPASTPGGLWTSELFEAVHLAGQHPSVKAMDLVCLDPVKDVAQMTVKTGVHVMLSFLTGYSQRKNA